MSKEEKPGLGTRSVWAGEQGERWQNATQVPVVHSVSFGYSDLDRWLRVAKGEERGHVYGRNTNPTVRVFEEKVRDLEGAEAATSFATGMAAISSTLFALLTSGDRAVSIRDTYGGTSKLFLEFFPRMNLEAELCETTDSESIEKAIGEGCQLLYLESPTNPTMKVVDLARFAGSARRAGSVVVVDNTFATPVNQQPLELGADLVVHSATKFLGGHADALGGVVCGRRDLVETIFRHREIIGPTLHPEAAYLLLRGMKTLHLRIRHQNQSALEIARFLASHPRVERVFYPGLEDDPSHEIAKKQMSGFGGVLSFQLAGDFDTVREFLPRLRYANLAANLGSVETVAGPPATTSHVELSAEQRKALGIPESLVRYSVGIEETQDLIADLKRALDSL